LRYARRWRYEVITLLLIFHCRRRRLLAAIFVAAARYVAASRYVADVATT